MRIGVVRRAWRRMDNETRWQVIRFWASKKPSMVDWQAKLHMVSGVALTRAECALIAKWIEQQMADDLTEYLTDMVD